MKVPFFIRLRFAIALLWPASIGFAISLFFLYVYFQHAFAYDFNARFRLGEDDPLTKATVDKVLFDYEDYKKYEYSFITEYGEKIKGNSYADDASYQEGDKLEVRYDAEYPRLNMAVGMRNDLPFRFGDSGALVGVLFGLLIGLVFVFVKGYPKKRKALNYGIPAMAHFIRKEATSTEVNDQVVYRLFFEFETQQSRKVTAKFLSSNPWQLENPEGELLFYQEENPENILLADDVPDIVRKYMYKRHHKQQAQQRV